MNNTLWFQGVDFPITVCDKTGLIIFMNSASIKQFEDDGGETLIGKSLFSCHPEPARTKLSAMLETPVTHTFISESHGQKHIVHEAPWFSNSEFQGYVEISIVLPKNLL